MTGISTPWGIAESSEELAPGIEIVSTPSHGGLRMTPERWGELPSDVQGAFRTSGWAEEDCEAPIALAIFGPDTIEAKTIDFNQVNYLADVMVASFPEYQCLAETVNNAVRRNRKGA